jgi:hypothetical protein
LFFFLLIASFHYRSKINIRGTPQAQKNSKNTQIEETKANSFLNRKPADFIIEQEIKQLKNTIQL